MRDSPRFRNGAIEETQLVLCSKGVEHGAAPVIVVCWGELLADQERTRLLRTMKEVWIFHWVRSV
ncbi:unnamed protein product [Linum tenue]|uniref:Uncharacterized protein n=1 Tax=Linum tenue TaxID=586396 RepID=A0AAV0NGC0_9ROSI|nr:unnamed protein product [Linum tenue]CAI0457590.1 unnamed protein product [Linum tenue]